MGRISSQPVPLFNGSYVPPVSLGPRVFSVDPNTSAAVPHPMSVEGYGSRDVLADADRRRASAPVEWSMIEGGNSNPEYFLDVMNTNAQQRRNQSYDIRGDPNHSTVSAPPVGASFPGNKRAMTLAPPHPLN
jgi:hypothetical protein